MTDPFDLDRFVRAQAPVFEGAVAELRAGRKRGHWMWFIFPQLRGLGHSQMADRYGIASLAEARAYGAHPLLGPRLKLCTRMVLETKGSDLAALFGSPDDLKFRSSMTLFSRVPADGENVFRTALDGLCGGAEDTRTLAHLEREAGTNDPTF